MKWRQEGERQAVRRQVRYLRRPQEPSQKLTFSMQPGPDVTTYIARYRRVDDSPASTRHEDIGSLISASLSCPIDFYNYGGEQLKRNSCEKQSSHQNRSSQPSLVHFASTSQNNRQRRRTTLVFDKTESWLVTACRLVALASLVIASTTLAALLDLPVRIGTGWENAFQLSIKVQVSELCPVPMKIMSAEEMQHPPRLHPPRDRKPKNLCS